MVAACCAGNLISFKLHCGLIIVDRLLVMEGGKYPCTASEGVRAIYYPDRIRYNQWRIHSSNFFTRHLNFCPNNDLIKVANYLGLNPADRHAVKLITSLQLYLYAIFAQFNLGNHAYLFRFTCEGTTCD